MTTVDNGSIAVTLEWTAATVRAIDHVPTCARPPYVAVAQVIRLSDSVAKVVGLCGDMSRGHVWLLARALREAGFRWMYAERTGEHVVPMAEVIADGDFAGHWRMDLEAMQERRRPRGVKA